MKAEEYIIPINETAEDYDEMFVGVIRRQPVLIRCKECKWNKADKWVDCVCVMNGMYGRTTDNYCSLAERREDANI